MVKKFAMFLVALFMTILTAVPCWAMEFSAPVYLGLGGLAMGDGGFNFDGAVSNSPKVTRPNRYGNTSDWKGVARFGDGKNEIYYHYDSRDCRIGGKDAANTVPHTSYVSKIYYVTTDNGYVLYPIFAGGGDEFELVGKRPDGRFVKFIDSYEIKQRYFGEVYEVYLSSSFDGSEKIRMFDDEIIVPYGRGRDILGEFRFKWDKAAQWFGVERVVY